MTAAIALLYVSAICFVGAFLFVAVENLEPNRRLALVLKCAILAAGGAAIANQVLPRADCRTQVRERRLGNRGEDLALSCSTGGHSLELVMERRSLHSRPKRCDQCRNSLGLLTHRYWRMQFCSAKCVTAYKRRLDEKTIAKIRWLDFLSTPSTVAAQGNS